MNFLGNILWLICGGLIISVLFLLMGIAWCLTIVGIPIGIQCFKFAQLALMPFGKDIYYSSDTTSLILNILWLVFGGIEIAIACFVIGLVLCITVIGIPFGLQAFKFAKLALMPFGSSVWSTSNRY